jgi:hypothetical protein
MVTGPEERVERKNKKFKKLKITFNQFLTRATSSRVNLFICMRHTLFVVRGATKRKKRKKKRNRIQNQMYFQHPTIPRRVLEVEKAKKTYPL